MIHPIDAFATLTGHPSALLRLTFNQTIGVALMIAVVLFGVIGAFTHKDGDE